MSSHESQIAALPKGTEPQAEQARTHLVNEATHATGTQSPRGDAGHNTAAAHLPAVQMHDSGASQFWQGVTGELKEHPKNAIHSGEIGLGVGLATGLAIGGAAAVGIIALPEVAVLAGVAIAGGAALSAAASLYESRDSYTKGKDASPAKHAGAVVADMAAGATGGAIGGTVGAFGAIGAAEVAIQNAWAAGI
jgi:hypothetical protein